MGCEVEKVYKEFEYSFINWAKTADDIRAAFVVGSRARQDHPADDFSDLDIVIYSSNPNIYLSDSNWLYNIGDVTCSFVYKTVGGDPERLCLFSGGWQIDFVILSYIQLLKTIESNRIPNNFYRGVRTIIDKDNISKNVLPNIHKAPQNISINEELFLQIVSMFWFASLYTAKQILRGELWVAKSRDGNIKELLLQMVEWYSKAINDNNYDTWHAGRFINEWAPKDVLLELEDSFGHYNFTDSWRALIITINLFKRISREIADLLCYSYPVELENEVTTWIQNHGG